MARAKKVGFLQHFNGPRVIGPIRVDILGVVIGTFLVIYTSMTIAGVKVSITLLSAFAISYISTKSYVKAKEKSSKGYLWHLLYASGIWSVKPDPKKYEELNRMDVQDYFPYSTQKNFFE